MSCFSLIRYRPNIPISPGLYGGGNNFPSASDVPWRIYINTSYQSTKTDNITTTANKQKITKPCAYFICDISFLAVPDSKYFYSFTTCPVSLCYHAQYIPWNMFVLNSALSCLYHQNLVDLCDVFSHILQGYCIGTTAYYCPMPMKKS